MKENMQSEAHTLVVMNQEDKTFSQHVWQISFGIILIHLFRSHPSHVLKESCNKVDLKGGFASTSFCSKNLDSKEWCLCWWQPCPHLSAQKPEKPTWHCPWPLQREGSRSSSTSSCHKRHRWTPWRHLRVLGEMATLPGVPLGCRHLHLAHQAGSVPLSGCPEGTPLPPQCLGVRRVTWLPLCQKMTKELWFTVPLGTHGVRKKFA